MKRPLRLLVSLALVGIALWLLDWPALGAAVGKVHPGVFLLALLVSFAQFFATGLRWHLLLRPVVPRSLGEDLRDYFYGTFLNTFTPANVGGDVYRLVALRRERPEEKLTVPVLVVLVRERLWGLLSFFLFYLLAVTTAWFSNPPGLAALSSTLLATTALIVAGTAGLLAAPVFTRHLAALRGVRCRERLAATVDRLRQAAHWGSPGEFARLLALSWLALACWLGTVKLVADDLGVDLAWSLLGALVILVELVRLVPVSAQGIGVREGAYAYLLSLAGQAPETGFVLGTVAYLALSSSLLLAGLYGWVLMARISPNSAITKS